VITTMLVSLFLVPLFFSRYLLVVSGLFLLLVSLGMGRLPGKYLPWIAAGLFAILNVFTIQDIYTQYFNHPMRQAGGEARWSSSAERSHHHFRFYSLVRRSITEAGRRIITITTPSKPNGASAQSAVPPLHCDRDLTIAGSAQDVLDITCNTGVPAIADVLQNCEVKSSAPAESDRTLFPIMFTAQKYEYDENAKNQPQAKLIVHVTGLKLNGKNLFVVMYKPGAFRQSLPAGNDPRPIRKRPTLYDILWRLCDGDHTTNGNNAYDVDPQTGMPLDGFYIFNQDKLDKPQDFKQQITFDQIKFDKQPE
jgi:hypothetical protein